MALRWVCNSGHHDQIEFRICGFTGRLICKHVDEVRADRLRWEKQFKRGPVQVPPGSDIAAKQLEDMGLYGLYEETPDDGTRPAGGSGEAQATTPSGEGPISTPLDARSEGRTAPSPEQQSGHQGQNAIGRLLRHASFDRLL